MSRRPLLLVTVLAFACAAFAALARPGSAAAHPLGNFTINHYSRIEIYSDVVRVHYVLDMAEIPTFQENTQVDANGDDIIDPSEAQAFAERKARELATNLSLSLNGSPRQLSIARTLASFPEGQGGLPTTRLDVIYQVPAPSGETTLMFRDTNYSDRLGWREIVVLPGTGARLTGEYTSEDVSQALTRYPGDLLSSPLDVRSVSFSYDAGAAISAPQLPDARVITEAPARAGEGFAALINTNHLTFSAVLLTLLAAFAFGALHAIEPGHGKTLVAAYFVGVKGTVRQALGLGLIVAVTHTVGVLAIGLVAIFGSQWILPEKLYPWLSLASGLMVTALGVRLILARGGSRIVHGLSHLPIFGRQHHHHEPKSEGTEGIPPWRTLVGIGLVDGLTPSPSALVVLLAAVSLHRVGLGIVLIVSFSLGLAVVLTAISAGLLVFRQAMDSLGAKAQSVNLPYVGRVANALTAEGAAMRALPLTGAFVLLAAGILLTLRALGQPSLAL